MIRGTTPTIIFETDINTSGIDVLYIDFAQDGKIVLEKTKEDIEEVENGIKLELTQEDTLLFVGEKESVEIQIRVKYNDDSAMASNIMRVPVRRILKDGQI